MTLYEIRTFKSRRTSLISRAHYAHDVAAIMAARDLLRKGETVEVWREETLVYRTAPRMEHDEPGQTQPGRILNR